jgi:signal transduction histidine kinase
MAGSSFGCPTTVRPGRAAIVGRACDRISSARTILRAPKIVLTDDVRPVTRGYARDVTSAAASAAERRPRRSDLLAAGAVTLLAQLETWLGDPGDPQAAYAAAALAMTIPLAWRRIAPIAVFAFVFVPLIAMAAAGHPLEATYIMLVLLIAVAAVGSHCERRRATAGLVLGLVLLAAVLVAENLVPGGSEQQPGAGDLVFLGAILSAVWGLAAALRERGQHAGALQERAERLEREREERARAAVAQERARIARELHDVVAHSVSVIAVQTGSMRRRLRHERPAEAEELAGVEMTARQALAEMRRMLGLLRADDDDLSLAPQPGMDQVDRLVEQVRETGLSVELQRDGRPRPLSPGVDLAAYRIVQEALTNVMKHAGPANARVAVRFGERELELEVSDDGRGAPPSADGSGQGLVGMRERVALYGGWLDARAGSDGGFVVRARLPIGAA